MIAVTCGGRACSVCPTKMQQKQQFEGFVSQKECLEVVRGSSFQRRNGKMTALSQPAYSPTGQSHVGASSEILYLPCWLMYNFPLHTHPTYHALLSSSTHCQWTGSGRPHPQCPSRSALSHRKDAKRLALESAISGKQAERQATLTAQQLQLWHIQ